MTCSKPKILVVDDTPASLKLLSELLRAEDYEVRSAIDGELALESAFDNPPDLVLLDIMMPGIDGFEVCRRLKAHPATRQVPVIFVSTLSDTEEKVQGFQLGAVDYVSKPYQREELLARVRTHLEIERLRNRLEDAWRNAAANCAAASKNSEPRWTITFPPTPNCKRCWIPFPIWSG
ncbi:response regulator [Methylomonas koyamae]|uniref:response regulator n=1 Tax=Methylomonas koyamae TaxID=702114 RepID=UPI000B169023|nr:response regulator [Methylomonas koyamae]